MTTTNWHDLGPVATLQQTALQALTVERTRLALSYANGEFGAVSGVCNHAGGPLGEGHCDAQGYIVCPWHHWKFHRVTGLGEPGFEGDCVPRYTLKQENGHLFIDLNSATPRHRLPHAPHTLSRPVVRAPGPLRLLGLSTTHMHADYPRYSTSEALLQQALDHAGTLNAETQLLRIRDLKFRHCEGYYSKSAHACTWPCSITQMDDADEMQQVYEALVFWCDAVIISTPIRWGSASALYFKMIERMNCIQNQITIRNNILIRNKVAAFIITGGQDNIQAVAGQMLLFFSELGFDFPQFPFIAHSRGWEAEDMDNNVRFVQRSEALQAGSRALVERTLSKAQTELTRAPAEHIERAGRKAHRMESPQAEK